MMSVKTILMHSETIFACETAYFQALAIFQTVTKGFSDLTCKASKHIGGSHQAYFTYPLIMNAIVEGMTVFFSVFEGNYAYM